MVTRRRGWLVIFLSFSLVLPGSRALAQELSLEAAEQLRAQVFQALEPAAAWEGWVRLAPDQEPARVTALGLRRLRIDGPGEPGPIHVWNEGWTYVGSEREGWLGPSPALVTLYQSTLLPFLFLDQLARAPLVGVTVEGAGWALELQDRELGRVWVEVEGARPARIWAEDETVLWELEPAPEAALHASLHLPGGPHLRLVLEPLETGWVSRAADGPEWVGRRAVDPPEEAFFRPGRLGQLLAALDRYEAASAEGQRAEARRALREAIRLAPNRTALYTELGVLELRAGNWQGALAAFDQAFQLDPDDPLLANNLAYLLIDTGLDPHRGVALARQAVERRPDEPAFLDTLGWGYTVTGQLEQGAAALARARELAASLGMAPAVQAEILYHLAETLARMGRTDEAADLAQEAVRLDPELEPARELLERLG